MSEEFNLIFKCRATGLTFKGKRLADYNYILIHPVTGLRIHSSNYLLRKSFVSDKANKKGRSAKKRYLPRGANEQTYMEYLRGTP